MSVRGSNKYGLTAVQAAEAATGGENPVHARESAAAKVFVESPSSQRKGCSKSTFLGLAEAGEIVGVPAGSYTRSVNNKRYAVAVLLLRENQANALSASGLSIKVLNSTGAMSSHASGAGASKVHNSQMDVVIALWQAHKVTR
jgi:hypothetical protein